MFELNIPLERMEDLETKYNVHLIVEQYRYEPDEYYVVDKKGKRYAGSTLDEVEKSLEEWYGNKNI